MMNLLKYGLGIALFVLCGCTEVKEEKEVEKETPQSIVPSGEEKKVTQELALEVPHVVVLGVAQDAGYPQAGCQKECCASTWGHPEKHRKATCLGLVDPISNESWMFEATPDFKMQLRLLQEHSNASDLAFFKGIFLTHGHMGHYTGLMHLGREVMGTSGIPVYAMPRMKEYLTNNGPWSQLVKLNNIALMGLKAETTIELNERLKVTPYVVPHRDEFTETVGFLIEGPKRKLLFIPDIDKWDKWGRYILDMIREYDLLLIDGTFYSNGEIPGRDMSEIPHPFIEESMQQFSELNEADRKKVYFIHFNHTNPVLQSNSDAAKEVTAKGFNIATENLQLGL
jgi:pyrroloquinoline quinone biosynthesis protein B